MFHEVATPSAAASRLASRVSCQRHDFLIGVVRLLKYKFQRKDQNHEETNYLYPDSVPRDDCNFIRHTDKNKEAIISKEKAAWQAFKDKKADEFKKLLSADLVTVYADGMHSLQQEVDAMAKTDMKSFDLSDFNVVFPNHKTAVHYLQS